MSSLDCATRPAYLRAIFDFKKCEGNPRSVVIQHAAVSRALFSDLQEAGEIKYIDMVGIICPSDSPRCTYFDNSKPLYKDSNHLNFDAAVLLASKGFETVFRNAHK